MTTTTGGVAPKATSSADSSSDPASRPAIPGLSRAALWAALAGRSGWRRALLGLGALALAQALLAVPVGELAHHYGFDPHAGLIRGWALAAPAVHVWWLQRRARRWPWEFPRRAVGDSSASYAG